MHRRLSHAGLLDIAGKLDRGERLGLADGIRLFESPDLRKHDPPLVIDGPFAVPGGSFTSSPPKLTAPFEPSGTVQRFIDGEPMNPATKVLAGWS